MLFSMFRGRSTFFLAVYNRGVGLVVVNTSRTAFILLFIFMNSFLVWQVVKYFNKKTVLVDRKLCISMTSYYCTLLVSWLTNCEFQGRCNNVHDFGYDWFFSYSLGYKLQISITNVVFEVVGFLQQSLKPF